MQHLRPVPLGLLAGLALSLLLASPAPAQEPAAATELAQVSAFSGEVTIKVGATGEARKVGRVGTKIRNGAIYSGDEIATGADGKVDLLFSDGSVLSLAEPNSQIAVSHGPLDDKLRVGRAAGKQTLRRIRVLAGKLHGEISPGSAIYTEFETPSGVAGVKGTVLDITVTGTPPTATIGLGEDSHISFTDPTAGATVDLGNGQSAVFTWDPTTGRLGVDLLNDNGEPVQLRLGTSIVTLRTGDAVRVAGGENGGTVSATGGAPTIRTGESGADQPMNPDQEYGGDTGDGDSNTGGGDGSGNGSGDAGGNGDGASGDTGDRGADFDNLGSGINLDRGGTGDLAADLQQGGGTRPAADLPAPTPPSHALGADYLLMTLEFGHLFNHEIGRRLDPSGPLTPGQAENQFHAGNGPNAIQETPQLPSTWAEFGPGYDARVGFVGQNRDRLDTTAGMTDFARDSRPQEIAAFGEQFDAIFGPPSTSGGNSTQIFPARPASPFTRAEGFANTEAFFERLVAGNFSDPAAVKAAFNLALDRSHLDYHSMLEQGGLFNEFDHGQFHAGRSTGSGGAAPSPQNGIDYPPMAPPPFGGLDNLHTSFHASTGDKLQLHSWFHNNFCTMPGAGTNPDIQRLHELFHRIIGVPQDLCVMDGRGPQTAPPPNAGHME